MGREVFQINGYNVIECAKNLKLYTIRTPLVESEVLSDLFGIPIYLKLETFQRTAAFKFRGAMNYLLKLSPEERQAGVITASSGNHGLGMALGSKLLGIKCTVVMPIKAPLTKQQKAQKYGSRVLLYGNSYDEAACCAESLAKDEGAMYVPSFNHPAIIEGQGTILCEIIEDLPEVQNVVAPVGGGGLLAGLLVAKEELGVETRIVGVEPEGAACMQAAVCNGKPVTLPFIDTIADGAAVRTAGDITFDIVYSRRPTIITVEDVQIEDVQRILITEAKVLAEAAGALSVAGLSGLEEILNHSRNVVCIVSGANIDQSELIRCITSSQGS